jgi:uncharacterized protein YbjT (DUF2867 family)
MRLTIFAATGGIGRQLVDQAVAAGHDVTAVARNPQNLPTPTGQVPARAFKRSVGLRRPEAQAPRAGSRAGCSAASGCASTAW